MCGRSTASLDRNLEKLLHWSNFVVSGSDMQPGHHVNVLLNDPAGKMGMAGFRWEFEPETAKFYNARLETVFERNMWHDSFVARRGIMMLSSFWEKTGQFHAADDQVLLAGCIWKLKPVRMVSMLTMAASPLVATVHDRMPAFVPREFVDDWLDVDSDPKTVHELMLTATQPILEVL